MKQNKIPRNEYIIKPKGKTNPYKDDVVYSNLGQWKYPGQVTKIPSNQITMQGVNYPVQGIDDTGYSQMMYPGMDYTFPGESVTEYPMQFPFGGIHTKTDTHMATGGWLDFYKPGGEKPWGDMTAKERAAYLDAKEANAKAETTSRKQATKEHYQDYVKDSMKKTLEHPMFNTAQYFTPEGMAIGAIKGLANVGPDVAKGDYSSAAFDALTALPGVPSSIKYKIKDSSEYLKALGKGYLETIPKNLKYKINNYSDLKKIPTQYKNSLEEMTSPEGLSRLKDLGVDDTNDFIKFANNVKKTGLNTSSQYLNINQGAVNVNPSQVKKFKKTLLPLATNQNAIDHEYGHMIQHYLENKGKTYKGLTDLDIKAVDQLLPHVNEETSNFLKNITYKDPKTVSNLAEESNQQLPLYFFKGGKGKEPLAHLRETKRAMKEANIINNIHEPITPEHIKNYIKQTGNKDRITSFLKNTPEAHNSLSNLLNKTPVVIPIGIGALGAGALQQEKFGGWLDNLDKAQFGKILSKPLTFLTKTEMLAKPGRNMAYRKIGNSAGLRDLIEKKGAQAPAPMKMRSGSYADTPFFGMDQRPNENYKGIFAVEVDPRNPKYDWTSRVAGTNNLGVAPVDAQTKKLLKNVPIEDLNVYKKKWFSNNYKKLDPANLEEGLKYANLQSGLENAWKWGARGAATVAAHDYMSDDESAWWPQIKNEVKSNKYIGPYLPKEEEGGWLDSYDKGGKIDMRKVKMNYFPKSNVEAQSRLDEEKAWENDYYRQQDKDYKNEVNAAVKKGIPRKQAELVIKKYKTEPQEQSTVVAHTPQGKLSKALEVATNPVLAMKNYKGHRLPDNFSSNAEEDLFSPSSVSNLGYQFLSLPGKIAFATSSGDEAVKNVKDKDYLMAGVNAAFSAPVFSPLKNLNKLKKSGTVNKASKVLSAAPENNFTYKGVIEPFEGASKLVRDETNAYYDFLQGRQNPKLAGRWTNQNEDLMKKFPLTSKSSTGIIEKPTDPEYYKNFLVNGKSIPKNKKGGQKGLKKYTSKNVYTSVNDIMLRNEKVFGPAGKRRYKPGLNYKDGGGWLDNMY